MNAVQRTIGLCVAGIALAACGRESAPGQAAPDAATPAKSPPAADNANDENSEFARLQAMEKQLKERTAQRIAHPPKLTIDAMRACTRGYYQSTEEKFRIFKMEKIHSTCRLLKYYQGAVLREERRAGTSKPAGDGPLAEVFSLGLTTDRDFGAGYTSVEQWLAHADHIGTVNHETFGY